MGGCGGGKGEGMGWERAKLGEKIKGVVSSVFYYLRSSFFAIQNVLYIPNTATTKLQYGLTFSMKCEYLAPSALLHTYEDSSI